jgi:hypothetical protein
MNLVDQQLTDLIAETVEQTAAALRWRNSMHGPSLEWQAAGEEHDRLTTRVTRLEEVRQQLRDLQARIEVLAPTIRS